jgi:hypothetical protein
MPVRAGNQPLLMMATKEDLMYANNSAYMTLYNEKVVLESRLVAQK